MGIQLKGDDILSLLNVIGFIKQYAWTVIRAVILANRDYPYHDFITIEDGTEPTVYVVGTTQVNLGKEIKKRFISKSTMIFSDVACTIRFNHTENAPITIRANLAYEFLCNVTSVYVSAIGTGGYIDMGFEGVLSEETRKAE